MHVFSQFLSVASGAAGLWAAYQWYRSTKIEVPCDLRIDGYVHDGHPDLEVYGLDGINGALSWQSYVNRQAAMWTGIAVLLSVFASILSNFGL